MKLRHKAQRYEAVYPNPQGHSEIGTVYGFGFPDCDYWFLGGVLIFARGRPE